MGITRLDDLPERRLVSTLNTARQAGQERKGSPQRASGANLAYRTSQNPGTFDWSGVLDADVGNPAYRQARFIITLTSSRAEVPLVDLARTVYYSSDGGVTYSEYSQQRGNQDSFTATAPEIWQTISPLPGFENEPGEVKYYFQLFGRSGTYAAFKLQAVGTDDVTISVVRTV